MFYSVPTPKQIKNAYPLPRKAFDFIQKSRLTISDILSGKDQRLLVVVGPCSINDLAAAQEFAYKIKKLQEEVKDEMFLVMRTYVEKARSSLGWKGFLTDPDCDGTNAIVKGVELTRKFLLFIASLNVPTASEFVDPLASSYYKDLISWGCIGARTSTSQMHRQFVSGVDLPIGFKNSIDGNVDVAIDAITFSKRSHHYFGVDEEGKIAAICSEGNPHCHIVLRGSNTRPNFDALSVERVIKKLEEKKLNQKVMIDCSHGNSGKCHEKQEHVFRSVIQDYLQNHRQIFGIMTESYLKGGKVDISISDYGRSVTDPCMDWETTKKLILWAKEKLALSSRRRLEVALANA